MARDPDWRENLAKGLIRIGDFQKQFEIPLEFWSYSDYQEHWKQALRRLLDTGESCLISSLQEPGNLHEIHYWIMYKEEKRLFFKEEQINSFNLETKNYDMEGLFNFFKQRHKDVFEKKNLGLNVQVEALEEFLNTSI